MAKICSLFSQEDRENLNLEFRNVKYPFMWAQAQDNAFKNVKHLVSIAPVLQYYDLNKLVSFQVDASEEGVRSALLQSNSEGRLQPVTCIPNSLNATEQRYSQIEKECLAICNAFGKSLALWQIKHTSSQPLETICKKALHKALARLQKMTMRLQRYRFAVKYKKKYKNSTWQRRP